VHRQVALAPEQFWRYIASPTAGHSRMARRARVAGSPLNGLLLRVAGLLAWIAASIWRRASMVRNETMTGAMQAQALSSSAGCIRYEFSATQRL